MKGYLICEKNTNKFFFRKYDAKGNYRDYKLWAEAIPVEIDGTSIGLDEEYRAVDFKARIADPAVLQQRYKKVVQKIRS